MDMDFAVGCPLVLPRLPRYPIGEGHHQQQIGARWIVVRVALSAPVNAQPEAGTHADPTPAPDHTNPLR